MSQLQQTVTKPTAAPRVDAATRRRIIIASMVGTTIEFYDFYVYATAAVAVFPYLFFPKNDDPTIGLLAWRSSPALWVLLFSVTLVTVSAGKPPWLVRC